MRIVVGKGISWCFWFWSCVSSEKQIVITYGLWSCVARRTSASSKGIRLDSWGTRQRIITCPRWMNARCVEVSPILGVLACYGMPRNPHIIPLDIRDVSNPSMPLSQRATKGLERITDDCRFSIRWHDHGSEENNKVRLFHGSDFGQPVRRVLEQHGQTAIVLGDVGDRCRSRPWL